MIRPLAGPVVMVLCVALLAGCATYDYRYRGNASAGQPGSFSDDVSRDLVRQTRKLLVLQTQDYLVGADDVLAVSIFEWEMTEQTKTLECRVAESGIISLPVLGAVHVINKTIRQTQKTIEDRLSEMGVLQNPRVAVSVKEYRSRRISVIGAVNAPGVYAIHQNVSTLMDMLTLAGGPDNAAGQTAYVLRKKRGKEAPIRIVVDLEELFDKGNFELNAVLQGGDIVYVPRAPLIYVYGKVRSPGGFVLRRSMRVLESIALAGGFSSNADMRHCFLVRRAAGSGEELVVRLDVARIERGKDPDVFLREGDVLRVPHSRGKTVLTELWDVVRGVFTFTYRLDRE